MSPTLCVAAKALIVNNEGKVLLLRESAAHVANTQADRYGLVGGRVEPGEAFQDALRREVREETGLKIEPLYPLYVGEWRPVVKGEQLQIIAVFMLCKAVTTQVKLSEEHDDFIWINPRDYTQYDMMPPDDLVIQAHIDRLV